MPSAAGLKAHVQLARISNFIVCNVYQVSPSRQTTPDAAVDQSMAMLERWQKNLPPSLQMPADGVLSSDPGTCMLHMHFNHLVIHALRPTLLAALKNMGSGGVGSNSRRASQAQASSASASPSIYGSTTTTTPSTPYSEVLGSAAQRNMKLARHVATLHRPRRLLHSGLHFVLTSVLCFQLQSLLGDEQASMREVDFAIELFEREAQTGNTYGLSSASGLRELKALSAIVKNGSNSAAASATAMELDASLDQAASWGEEMADGSNPNNLYEDVLTWMDQDWTAYDAEMQQ